MQAHPVFAARDLGRVGAPAHDRTYGHRVAARLRRRRNDDAVAKMKSGVGGEALVYGYGPRVLRARTGARDCPLRRDYRRGQYEQNERELQRRADALQCEVSFSDSRVSASVYDGAL